MQAMMMLAGKWVWIWNWQTCEGGDALRIAARLRAAGCSGALVKAFDGPRWFDQGRPAGLLERLSLARRPIARLDVRGLCGAQLRAGAGISGRRPLPRRDRRLSVPRRGAGVRAAGAGERVAWSELLVLRAHERRNVAGRRLGDDWGGGRDVQCRIRSAKRVRIAARGPRRSPRGGGRGYPQRVAGRCPTADVHRPARRHAPRNRSQLRPRWLAAAV